jgi:hypothetical protein
MSSIVLMRLRGGVALADFRRAANWQASSRSASGH